MPHSPKTGAEAATVLHFAAIVPDLGPHQEWHGAAVPPVSWYTPAFEIKDGAVAVPTTPGLGIQYDEEIWRTAEKFF